jgi:hypothetical protein
MNDQMYSYELRWIFHQMCVVVAVLFCCHRGEKCGTFSTCKLSKFQNKMCKSKMDGVKLRFKLSKTNIQRLEKADFEWRR